ncbi:MAG: response regulator [Pseudomonadota bacterium]
MPKLTRIFYVEDEPDILEVAKIALGDIGGFEVGSASSGQEALQRLAAFSPDLILLDVMMPGMDGPTTLCELRKIPTLKDIPVIFMTAKVQPKEIEHFKAIGALEVIAKPFDPMTLAGQLSKIWERHCV